MLFKAFKGPDVQRDSRREGGCKRKGVACSREPQGSRGAEFRAWHTPLHSCPAALPTHDGAPFCMVTFLRWMYTCTARRGHVAKLSRRRGTSRRGTSSSSATDREGGELRCPLAGGLSWALRTAVRQGAAADTLGRETKMGAHRDGAAQPWRSRRPKRGGRPCWKGGGQAIPASSSPPPRSEWLQEPTSVTGFVTCRPVGAGPRRLVEPPPWTVLTRDPDAGWCAVRAAQSLRCEARR